MTGRVLVTARCRKRGHVLAELLAGSPLAVRVPHYAVGSAKGGRVVNRRGGPLTVPLEDEDMNMTFNAMCADGVHAVHSRDLADAARAGTAVIMLSPVMR